MQKITPFLWFDDNAEEAVNFYTSLFKNSRIGKTSRYDEAGGGAAGRPAGSLMTVDFYLDGQEFAAMNAGPVFKFNPSISFFVVLEDEKEVDNLWNKLLDGGKVLMEYQKYDWAEKYGWLEDRFGLSWQISFGKKSDVGQTVTPSLLFVGSQFGKAEEAVKLYTSVFNNSEIMGIMKNPSGDNSVLHAQFKLNSQVFMAMDSNEDHNFNFNEAISFVVNCDNQEEVDYFWNKLTSDGGAESMCGWLKDKFGVSWQITPTILPWYLTDKDPKKSQAVMKAMLQMKKIDIAALEKAYKAN
jgi:predicted 3-demethylubiquinone-9 3-methyltransferase (glyoxalase superfamily)